MGVKVILNKYFFFLWAGTCGFAAAPLLEMRQLAIQSAYERHAKTRSCQGQFFWATAGTAVGVPAIGDFGVQQHQVS